MPKKPSASPKNFVKIALSIIAGLVVVVLLLNASGSGLDHRALIIEALKAREQAINSRDIEAYLQLISPDYQYKDSSKSTLRKSLGEQFNYWDNIHIDTYNRVIRIHNDYAEVSQDFQMSVEKKGKTKLISGPENFVMKKSGYFHPTWKFYNGLDFE